MLVTSIDCMKIPNNNLLIPIINTEKLEKYIIKDKEYTITPIPITTRRFGPSGSLIKTNINLEIKTDVINNIINDIFFDLKYIL
ncbi:MAG: hypothetical protein ACYCZW_01210 [Minisyncoccota bacterium]